MSLLSNEQKQLLFDYCLGLTNPEQTAEAEKLISSDEEAADIHSRLKITLSPLDCVEPERCPDDLAERTIFRLCGLADSSQLDVDRQQGGLQQLLAAEQARPVTSKSQFWRNLVEVISVAAVIVLFAVVLTGPLSFARQKAACQAQMSNIFRGLSGYAADHDGSLPSVPTKEGCCWWKVGCQSKENCSNTRHTWLLVKNGYVDMVNFVCPGRREKIVIQFIDPSEVGNYKDFPSREHITYSQPVWRRRPKWEKLGRQVLLTDLNPLFEGLPRDHTSPLGRKVTKELSTRNSMSHNYRGQHVMRGDGSVEFIKTRFIGTRRDDIFTIEHVIIYRGNEIPASETDLFNAP
jgi:hypothetical protein